MRRKRPDADHCCPLRSGETNPPRPPPVAFPPRVFLGKPGVIRGRLNVALGIESTGHDPLRPKPFAVLRCLVSQAGQLVTKGTLLEAVWPNTAVSESALSVAIRHLRRVLADPARTPQFIETVHGRGYWFMAPVMVAESAPRQPQTAETWRPRQPVAPVSTDLFVGRRGELAQLKQCLITALQGKRLVGVIAGEPGIGKTVWLPQAEAALAPLAGGAG